MPFEIVRNDITRMRTTAIVNAANNSLLGGGGVDGAIHRAAGPELLEECRGLHGCETGRAKITRGYRLPAEYVIHTVGPVWQGGGAGERELLFSCYRSSLELAAEYHCESVAFPLISAGAYGYPREEAMAVAVEAICGFLLTHEMQVYLVVFGREAFFRGRQLFRNVREYVDDRYVEEALREDIRSGRRRLQGGYGNTVGAAPAPRRKEARLKEAAFDLQKDAAPTAAYPDACAGPDVDWEALFLQTDEGFSGTLLRLIDRRGMKDADCYKRANVDRRLFSKIRSDPDYRPSKPTACAFAAALELSLPEAEELLGRAGYRLSRSSRFDLVMEYCFSHRFYDVMQINEVLFEYDLPLLGSGAGAKQE